MKLLRVLYFACLTIFGLAAILATSKPDIHIDPHESFMLVYADTNNNIQVKYSDDGNTWSTATVPASIASNGVGASGSNDNAAVTRLLAYTDSAGSLKLKFGLGAGTWDSSSLTYSNVRPGKRPTIVDIGKSNYLIAYAEGNQTKVMKYDHTARQLADVTPALPGLPRSPIQSAPAMTFRDGKVVLSWLRYETSGGWTKPLDILVALGSIDSASNVTWTNGYTFNDPSNSASNFYGNGLISEPSLTRDRSRFYLGALTAAGHPRQPGTCPQNQVLNYKIWWSYDGLTWYNYRFMGMPNNPNLYYSTRTTGGVCVKPRTETAIEIAQICKGAITTIAFIGGPTIGSVAKPQSMYRLVPPNVTFQEISPTAVFGSNLPAVRRFSLISVGKAENIYLPGVPGNHCWN